MRPVGSSFRDPAGTVYSDGQTILRSIRESARSDYERLMTSGLYEHLVSAGLLIPHSEVHSNAYSLECYKLIQPEQVKFISYPYEWCFEQLKDAALATLAVNKAAISFGMILKDASAFNIQFHKGKPVFIDTLSFTQITPGKPWVAYRQFCQHFLLPLAAMAYGRRFALRLMQTAVDGIPLEETQTLVPARAWANPHLAIHLLAHSKFQQRYAGTNQTMIRPSQGAASVSVDSIQGMIASLEAAINSLKHKRNHTEWADYYNDTNYTAAAFDAKKKIIEDWLQKLAPKIVWDLGGNVGVFSRIATKCGAYTICMDVDPACVQKNYQTTKEQNENSLLPLYVDLSAPAPAIGWANRERMSLSERSPADALMALGLLHHLVIRNNLPLVSIAEYFSTLAKHAMVEWIPPSDSQVQRIAGGRWSEIHEYTRERFEAAFAEFFVLQSNQHIAESDRILYSMKSKFYLA